MKKINLIEKHIAQQILCNYFSAQGEGNYKNNITKL